MLIIIANLVALHTKNTLVKSLDNVTLSYKLLQELAQLDMLLVEAETGQRGYLYTGKEIFLDPYNEANASINVQLAELREKMRNPAQQEKLGQLQTLIKERIDYLEKTIQLQKSGREQEVKKIVSAGTGLEIMAKLRGKITEIKESENRFLDEKKKLAREAEIFSTYFALSSTLMIVGVGALISWVIIRNIAQSLGIAVKVAEEVSAGNLTANISATYPGEVGQLLAGFQSMTESLNSLIGQVQNSGIQVTASSKEIAASGKELEATVTEQAASIRDVEATTKEIAAISRQLKKTMEEITSTFQTTTIAAEGGRRNLSQMENTMRDLATATTSISSQLTNISEKANNINRIIITITKVSDQTNLLSLNAAIEAEKAGKYGMGFAVVAREIRRLADQTAVATLDIEKMVKEMQAAVSTGVTEMNNFTEEVNDSVEDVESVSWQLTEIIEQVQAITPRFEVVNQSMEAQSEGAQQISEVMVYLSQTSSQTAGALREINGAISQLNDASQNLRQEISRFKVSSKEAKNV
ncbi:MAG: HAMP domain-containing protein [Oscillatoriales cyanobacterium]|uniref:methyl-accepting chemotaxis protein n=1 Tax=unclassified Microcoleus TaxID=2642155 RepID=UPI001D684BBE|nr:MULTISPECIES: CHASE3 domain-containing protein [unclassified Microcoleus]TAE79508.1 MAG: HAMP domain-containing protein [Oscillatoriales cyanobacterium]TAE96517.1 MAG: HAMP domain-containing protein [Oscillatoriales cyanobacterium]TAF17055.1 MAG: HAMP domain-containing protein [Oscillatoriales cyanobacterium]TAF29879.1 MAG: HAMP domain-containing protein [Oscillatoriales cyanobacterium]TAF53785.1 MAG: HAMP domain-containing protein [Oscillatoriales cyanobacterium]